MSGTERFCAADESARILSAILERSSDSIIRADLDGIVTGWSPGAARLFGYTAEETVGSSAGMLIPDEKWGEFVQLLERIREGQAVNHLETVRRARNGRLVNVVLSLLPVTDESNRVVGLLSISRDVTELKHAESAYRASEARWRAIIDSAVDAIIVIDSRGRIETFNSGAERLFGYRAEEILGQSVNLLMPPPFRDEHDAYLAAYLAGAPGKVIGLGREVTARRRNGEDFPARLAVAEASVDGETRFTGILHDLTGRVQMERRLREQSALARLGEMTAIVAHEVRNALAAVRGTVQVVATRFEDGSREQTALEEAAARIDALTKIVQDMLLFAHLPEPRLARVDLAQLVAATVRAAESDPALDGIRIDVAGDAAAVDADADLLRIVLLSLITNAAQAMRGAGQVHVRIRSAAPSCEIAVVDHGPGVPPDVRDRLFTPFFTTKSRGSGLGLATARRIVEAHGGHVAVECPSEGGTRVVITIPAAGGSSFA